MQSLSRGFAAGFKSLPSLLAGLLRVFQTLWEWLCGLRRWCEGKKCRDGRGDCPDIPEIVHKRADPLIYSQHYLMAQGLSVTWDNPDIQLFKDGTPVPSSSLELDTEYDVQIQIWNGSFDAPAVGLDVELSFLDFGAGTTSHFVGATKVDLGAKGGVQHPAYAHIPWRTPSTVGHYCLQAKLHWADDANPNNNLGQENTNVGITQSPALFEFTVGNRASRSRLFRMAADMFEPPPPDPCPPGDDSNRDKDLPPNRRANVPAPYSSRREESEARWREALNEQRYGLFPIANEWDVNIDPVQFTLTAGEERVVKVSIEPKFSGFTGPQPFNIHAFAQADDAQATLVGGVTLVVKGS